MCVFACSANFILLEEMLGLLEPTSNPPFYFKTVRHPCSMADRALALAGHADTISLETQLSGFTACKFQRFSFMIWGQPYKPMKCKNDLPFNSQF